MARKVREEEQRVFQLLKDSLPDDMLNKVSEVKRNIFFSQKTYEVVANSHLVLSETINGMRVLLVEYDKTLHICMPRILFSNRILDMDSEVENQDILFGIGILAINSGIIKIQINISRYKIFDSFFAWEEDKEFQCSDIFEAFEEYVVFELGEEDFCLEYTEDISRILCILLFSKNSDLYGDEFYNNIFDVLVLESSRSIIPMLHSILQTTNTDLIFLQLYRCLEYLYIIHRAVYLGEVYDITLKNILMLLDNENIRYPEASSMREIIARYCDGALINRYYDYLLEHLDLQPCKEDNKKEKVSDYIYDTRCKIAHFKYGQAQIKDKDTLFESNILLSEVVKSVFQTLDEKIIKINVELNSWEKLPVEIIRD